MESDAKEKVFVHKLIGTIVESIINFFILFLLVYISMPSITCIRYSSEHHQKSYCKSNIRILTAAIEMYNMDATSKMQSVDQDELVKGKYLKKILGNEYSTPCSYKTFGDLAEEGIIYCELHGDVNGVKIEPGINMQDYKIQREKAERELEKQKNSKHLKNRINVISSILLVILMFVIPLIHLILKLVFSDKSLRVTIESWGYLLFFICFFCYKICQ